MSLPTKNLQENLNKYFKSQLLEDGIMGPATQSAVDFALEKLKIDNIDNLSKVLKTIDIMEDDYSKVFVLYEPLKEFGKKIGVFDPVIFLAQFALETGYMHSVIRESYNLGNIKAKDGEPYVESLTTEYIQGKPIKVIAKFRKYKNYMEFIDFYLNKLLNLSRYEEAKNNIGDAEKFYTALQKGGYATDPNYAKSLMVVYSLMKYFSILMKYN